jgi:signal transduction histidine kinase
MDKLITWLITLSDINKNIWIQKIWIYKNIKGIIKSYETEINIKNIKININKKYNLNINANVEYFEILFSNLFGNAIKYNKSWWKVKITINKNSLIIEDTWIWINVKNIDKIFDRFFQESNNRNIDWFWIGLSLVKKISNIYWWRISLKSKKWKWTKIIIEF